MNKLNILAAAACVALVACNKEYSSTLESGLPARIQLSFDCMTKGDIQTSDEAKVTDIKVFVFNGNNIDAYEAANTAEIAAKSMEVSCTQGIRDIWVIVNGPAALSSVTTKSALKESVSSLTSDNASARNSFVMVGKAEGQTVTASFSKTVNVDRIVSRVRLFQIRRNMSNEALAALPDTSFKIIRAYVTCVVDNACYDVFSPIHPVAYDWISSIWANSAEIATTNGFIYDKLDATASVAEDASYGTAYADVSSVAAHTFYVYPQEYSCLSNPVTSDQMKLVVECKIAGNYYTYPIPLGQIGYNKTYDVKLLTITRLGNNSDGDDVIDEGEDDVILPSVATFSVSVNDWGQVLTFGSVEDGNISI